ncbi:MAG: ATP-binding protein [Saprospiraceae bacterium]
MTSHTINFFITLSFLLLGTSLPAQKYLFDAKLLTSEDGLANTSTSSVHKDKNGYLWVGTKSGLNRYDGYNFNLYTKEKNNLFKNNKVHQIKEDAAGNLWLFYFSDKGHLPTSLDKVEAIDIFNPQTGKATSFNLFFKDKAPFTLNELNNPHIIDDKSRIWLTTKSGELYLFKNGQFLKIYEQENAFIQYVTVDNEGNIWLGYDKTITKINLDGVVQETQHLSDDVLGIWTDNNEQLWWATGNWVTEHWKHKPTDKLKKYTKIWSKEKQGTVSQLILNKDGEAITLDFINTFFLHRSKAGYWYAQIENQLNLFDRNGQFMYNYHNHHDIVKKDLRVGYENYFEADNDEFWSSTPLGLLKTKVSINPFKLTQGKNGHADYRGITEAENGTIFFQCIGLYQFNPKNSTPPEKNNLQRYYTLIYEDSIVWSGTYSNEYLGTQLDLRTKELFFYEKADNLNRLLSYTALKTTLPSEYLIGTDKGLCYLNIQQKKIRPFTKYNGFDTLKQSQVYHFHKNAKGIWLATNNGVFLMDEVAGIVRKYNITSKDLPVNSIRYIHETKAGVFWLATKDGGIIRWEPAQTKGQVSAYQQFTTQDGLSDNATYAIYGDDYGKLWVPSDKGLMCFDEKNFGIRTYLTKDGLPHNEFNLTAHYEAKDGTLYFGGLGGLISFHPETFRKQSAKNFPLRFNKFNVLEAKTEDLTDRTAILERDSIIIIHPTDKLSELYFSFSDYDTPDQHQYTYRLKGYINDWMYMPNNHLRIPNLPYGDYQLEVRGKNLNTHWSSEELVLGIKVLKPFYLQWWFLLGILVAVANGVLFFVKWRLAALEKKRQVAAIQELDKLKTRFFTNITHEFRTPLTLIIGPLEQMLKKQSVTMNGRSIKGVLKNARHLLNLINQLLDLSKLEHGGMKVAVSHGDIVHYTEELVEQIKPLADKKELTLRFFSNQSVWKINFDKNKWNKIINNLLSNAIKFTPNGEYIQIKLLKIVTKGVDSIYLEITDSGVGIEKEQLPKIFNRFYQVDGSTTRFQEGTGIGLAMVKELITLQGGTIEVTSELGEGTSFEIKLPILEATYLDNALQPIAVTDDALPQLPALEQTVEEAVAAISPTRERLKILIIEDNDEMRAFIREHLDTAIYEISEANNGIEGIEKAVNIIPDLVISDVMMPGKDGFEVTHTLRNTISTSHIPIILLTAKAALDSKLEGLKRGADAYLTKPFNFEELTTRIQKLIEIRQLLQQRFQKGVIKLPENKAILPFEAENEFMKEIRAIIEAHLNTVELNGAFIGAKLGMSRMQLHRKLKALINQSATELIKETRLQTAHQLLLIGKYNSSEVAYRTGFNTPAYFSSTFKKRFGFSPSEILKEG